MEIPTFETKKELFKFLVENKDKLIAHKKAETKYADGFLYVHSIKEGKIAAIKANDPVDISDKTELKVVAIINTTNLMDSHLDVHIPGIWKKSLNENKFIMHLQEHKSQQFDKIIAEGKDLNVSTKFFKWSELGFDFEGQTQALVFESTVKESRNEFMFKQYANGFVKNHSVGMRYVKLLLAINDEDEAAEFEAWEKYLPEIANKQTAIDRGYFWVVKEAKVIEGSAVPLGSNFATPTLENNAKQLTELEKEINKLKEIINIMKEPQPEPVTSTQIKSTQNEIDLLMQIRDKLIKN